MTIYAVITFHTTHFALKAKKVLQKDKINIEMIPVPRELSSDCGFCCKVPWEDKRESEKILKENSVEVDCFYRWELDDNAENGGLIRRFYR